MQSIVDSVKQKKIHSVCRLLVIAMFFTALAYSQNAVHGSNCITTNM